VVLPALRRAPADGRQEIVLFDRSWYNRAGVEPVMGFSTAAETSRFLKNAPVFEQLLVDEGISLTKFWFSVTQGEQADARQAQPGGQMSVLHRVSLPKSGGPRPGPSVSANGVASART
jgi:polyphosphate kinase 2 (PPK2 family)